MTEIRTHPNTCCLCGSGEATVVGTGIDFEYDTCSNSFDYVKCEVCEHHYLNPLPDPSELSTIYPANYGNYSNSVNPGLAYRVKGLLEGRHLRKLAGTLREGGVALDIGCGDGRLLDGIRKHCPGIEVAEGVEISETAAMAAIAKGYTVHVGNVDDLDLPSDHYDLVCLIQVIEHVYDPVACIEKVWDCLKPGGIALFETPSVECLDARLFRKRYWGGYHFPRHFNLFNSRNFVAALRKQGFEVVSLKHKLQPVHWVWTCHHYLKEKGYPARLAESFNIRNPWYLALFSAVDLIQLTVLRRSSNMQVIVRK